MAKGYYLLLLAVIIVNINAKNIIQLPREQLQSTYDVNVKQQGFIGSSVLDEVPLVDGHNDLPYNLYNIERNIIHNFTLDQNLKENDRWRNVRSSHTDLPRLRTGKVGGQFWVAYVSCQSNYKDAVELTLDQIDVIKRLVAQHPNDMKLVSTADGITAAFNEKKIASLICVEGGHSIDSRMSILRLYYELGVRYLTLTHNCNLPWVDQNQMDSPNNIESIKIGGMSAWGKTLVKEMNRLGMMVDLSHVSKAVMFDAIEASLAPIIFSHSSAYSIYAHTRNVQDDVLLKVRENRGIVMVNFYSLFITGVEADATIDVVINHLEHIKNYIGVDYVGLGADYDGVGSTPVGLEDVSKYPALFDKLGERGWTQDELKKLAGLNLIRVFKEVERVRDMLAATLPNDIPIPQEDLVATNETFECRTNFRSGAIKSFNFSIITASILTILVAFINKIF